MTRGVDITYKIAKKDDRWQIVAVGHELEISLPFIYKSKAEAQRELDQVKKRKTCGSGKNAST